MITRGTAPGATRFITATTTIEVEMRAAELIATAADITATGAGIVPAAMKGTGLQMGTPERAAEITTAPAQRLRLSTEPPRLLEAMQNPAVRAASARAPSATTTMADRKGAFRHAEAPASVAEERVAAEDPAAAV